VAEEAAHQRQAGEKTEAAARQQAAQKAVMERLRAELTREKEQQRAEQRRRAENEALAKAQSEASEEQAREVEIDLDTLRAPIRQAGRLSESEVRELSRMMLLRCGLSEDAEIRKAPWYFHYELGLELAAKDDPQKAVDFLLAAVERRPVPKRFARMYGMWFTHYQPYLEIAANHAALGNWSCAYSALELSRETGEMATADADTLSRYRELMEECAAQVEGR
jgi:hypothetical protein